MTATPPQLMVCTAIGAARGAEAAAAAVAVAAAVGERAATAPMLLDLRSAPRAPRGTLLASAPARALESVCAGEEVLRASARGRVCFAVARGEGQGHVAALEAALHPDLGASVVVCVCDPRDFRAILAEPSGGRRSALLRTSPREDRPLLALLSRELLAEGVPVKAWTPPIGQIPARRALAGLEPGGESGRRSARFASQLLGPVHVTRGGFWRGALQAERAQAMPAVLGVALLVVAVALILAALGGAAGAKGRLQRSADLAALSAARSMRDDFPRLFLPPSLASGVPNPAHLDKAAYLERARVAARDVAERNGTAPGLVVVEFPDGGSFAPLRVRVAARGEIQVRGANAAEAPEASTTVSAKAEVAPPTSPTPAPVGPSVGTGGGYGGPLAYRQGEGMRPDVAAAFDRMAAAASADGISLVINSGYRSDAEQQDLWEQNPDPAMVAPPGTSLHRCGTELDLGPPTAYGWLASNATRFGFLQRYSWEAWHYGFTDGPEPCSAEAESGGVSSGSGTSGPGSKSDGRLAGGGGLPAFVPPRYRRMLLASAARNNVSAALLAAQIMAESNFNPNAVSSAGAQGISQFMPATAAAYGLEDPFDPEASIDAQGRMMGELLAQFGSIELALAAYNAGPGAVAACTCIPPYPETQAYVARIMGLLDGAGELVVPAPALEVRLVA